MAQTFGRFKLFKGQIEEGGLITSLLKQVNDFTKSPNISARSLGVEYLESEKAVIVSLGFAHETDNKAVEFEFKHVGNLNKDSLDKLETALEAEAAQFPNLICHEFFVDAYGDMFVVFMKSV